MTPNANEKPLPAGWIQQYHESGHPYYVDTQAKPPRSIWTHPYEDEQYLREHPEESSRFSQSQPPLAMTGEKQKRGLFGKLKDKAIRTKQERERMKQEMAMLSEQRRQQRSAMGAPMGAYTQSPQFYNPNAYAQPTAYPPVYGRQRRRRGGGAALPLAGGLAGGMLLGSMLDNDYGDSDYGDFGGGDFGGGDFGGD